MDIRGRIETKMRYGTESLVGTGQIGSACQLHINRDKRVIGKKPETLAVNLALDNDIRIRRYYLNIPTKDICNLGIIYGEFFNRSGIFLKIKRGLFSFNYSQLYRFYGHQTMANFRKNSGSSESGKSFLDTMLQKFLTLAGNARKMVNKNIGVYKYCLAVFYLSQSHRYLLLI